MPSSQPVYMSVLVLGVDVDEIHTADDLASADGYVEVAWAVDGGIKPEACQQRFRSTAASKE